MQARAGGPGQPHNGEAAATSQGGHALPCFALHWLIIQKLTLVSTLGELLIGLVPDPDNDLELM